MNIYTSNTSIFNLVFHEFGGHILIHISNCVGQKYFKQNKNLGQHNAGILVE